MNKSRTVIALRIKRLFSFCLGMSMLLLVGRFAFSQTPELIVQTGHAGPINSLAFSPDGRLLASAASDHKVSIWSVANGAQLRVISGHSNSVTSVQFSPNGQTLASGGDEGIKLWDVNTGNEVRTFKRYGNIRSLAFTPDGKTIAGLESVSGDHEIALWDVASGKLLNQFGGKGCCGWIQIAFSPNGRLLASVGADRIAVWNVATGQSILQINGEPVSARGNMSFQTQSIAFSPDGKLLVGGGTGTAVKMWSTATGKEVRSFAHGDFDEYVGSMSFHPGGDIIATGGSRTLKLWDTHTARVLHSLNAHTDSVSSVKFSPDGRLLASGGEDKTIRLWDVASGSLVRTLKSRSSAIDSVSFNADGTTMRIGTRDSTRLWNITTGTNGRTMRSGLLSPDGARLVTRSANEPPKLSDAVTGTQLGTVPSSDHVTFSPDGRMLAFGNEDFTITLWDVTSAREIRKLRGHAGVFFAIVFSSDGRLLASGSYASGNSAPGGADFIIKLWDVRTGRELHTIIEKGSRVLAFSPDGKWLATDSVIVRPCSDGLNPCAIPAVSLWDVATGKKIRTFETGKLAFETVDSLAFNPNGTILASAGNFDPVIRLWDPRTGQSMGALRGHSNGVNSVTFNGNGKVLASGSSDSTVRLWNVNNTNELGRLIPLDNDDWVFVTPDGRFDGSSTGWTKVLWRLNNSTFDSAPVDAFFEQFYSPKLLAIVMAGERPQSSLVGTNFSKSVKLPPAVRITSPKQDESFRTDQIEIVVEAVNQGGGVEDLRLYQNGKLISDDTRQLTRDTGTKTRTFNVILLSGVNTFRATAFNTDRTEAAPDEIKIELKALEASSNLYILSIGLNEYKNTRYNLNYGRADAQAVADAVEQRGRGIFKEIKKRVIFDAEATRANIEAAFSEIIKQARPQDAFVFYYAGHGVMSESNDKESADFYLVPYDVVRIYGDDGSLTTKGIAARNLRDLLKNVRAQKQLVILDACESGGAVESIAMRGASEEKAIAQLARSAGVAVFASAGQDQVATEFGKLGHGVFTYALLKGLSGEADGSPNDGKVTIKELEAYLNDQVPELTKLYRGKRQDPNSWTRGQDFPIAVR